MDYFVCFFFGPVLLITHPYNDAKNEITVTTPWTILVISRVSKVLSVFKRVLFIHGNHFEIFCTTRSFTSCIEFVECHASSRTRCEGFLSVCASPISLAVEHPDARADKLTFKYTHLRIFFVSQKVCLYVAALASVYCEGCCSKLFALMHHEDGPVVAKLPEVLQL
jgi:hypothetical protein